MHRRFHRDFGDRDLPDLAGEGSIRRNRRYTPPGGPSPIRKHRSKRRKVEVWTTAQIGDVVAQLTPRQAVVWLLNFETMISLYESTTDQTVSSEEREDLIRALRNVIGERYAHLR